MTRSTLVAANWKMHGQSEESQALLTSLKEGLSEVRSTVAIFPPALYIPLAHTCLAGSNLQLGAQNVHTSEQGAFTGEISAPMLADFDCRYVLAGHSERRELFGDTDDVVAEKFSAIHAAGMTPILCVGETLAQREAGKTADVVLEQIAAVVSKVGVQAFSSAVVAYEPVWAIGTGVTATPEQAQEVHRLIRQFFAGESAEIAEQLLLLYGGSVKAENAAELFAQQDIDGGLVGGASLQAEEFISICHAADQNS